jgi:hypothetical protein
MNKTNRSFLLFALIMLIGLLIGACAPKSYLNINYQLPLSSNALKGKSVVLKLKDMRPAKTIFSEKAKTEFKHFTGIFWLYQAREKKENFVVGAFDAPSLFKEAFSRRLKNMGLEVLSDQMQTEPVIEIVLQKFFLDLVDRKWVAEIIYEACLTKDNKLLAKETISGKAERIKVFRQADAEKVLGDIFTSIVNNLDIHKLLQRAEL